MFYYLSGVDESAKLLDDFCFYMKGVGLRSIEPLDVSVEHRVVSFKMNKQRLGRMYMRYGIVLLYKYNEDFTELLDFRCYRFMDKNRLMRVVDYESYFRSLLLLVIPDTFIKYSRTCKIKLINSFPPFEDEAIETIRQETFFTVGFHQEVHTPQVGMFVLEVDGVELVCKLANDKLSTRCCMYRPDFCRMPVLGKVHPHAKMQCMRKDKYLSRQYEWCSMELYLNVSRRKGRAYDPTLFNAYDMNSMGKCEPIEDEEIWENVDGEMTLRYPRETSPFYQFKSIYG